MAAEDLEGTQLGWVHCFGFPADFFQRVCSWPTLRYHVLSSGSARLKEPRLELGVKATRDCCGAPKAGMKKLGFERVVMDERSYGSYSQHSVFHMSQNEYDEWLRRFRTAR